MNKLMYRFEATRKKKKKRKKKKEIDPFLDTVCPFRASRVKIRDTLQKGRSAVFSEWMAAKNARNGQILWLKSNV